MYCVPECDGSDPGWDLRVRPELEPEPVELIPGAGPTRAGPWDGAKDTDVTDFKKDLTRE